MYSRVLDVHHVNTVMQFRRSGVMESTTHGEGEANDRIVLDLLTSVEIDGSRSQRRIAAELGIALGLVNAYLKRCVKKGLVKVGNAPARRYAYYLTPHGFSEKSRLTVDFLSASFSFFRRAKADCARVFEFAKGKGFHALILVGKSDLAEVAILCAVETGVSVIAVVDPLSDVSQFAGIAVVATAVDLDVPFDAVVITDVVSARESFDAMVAAYGSDRVFVPDLLGLRISNARSSAS